MNELKNDINLREAVNRREQQLPPLPDNLNERVMKSLSPRPLQKEREPQPKIPFWGTSFVAGPQGELLYEAPTDQEVETVVDVDMQRSEQVRRWWPFLRDRRIDAYGRLTSRFIDD